MYPKAAVDVSMLVPSIGHAQIPNPVKCKIPSQSPPFSRFQLKNYPLDSTKTQTFISCPAAASARMKELRMLSHEFLKGKLAAEQTWSMRNFLVSFRILSN
jgi:hypothetical protein